MNQLQYENLSGGFVRIVARWRGRFVVFWRKPDRTGGDGVYHFRIGADKLPVSLHFSGGVVILPDSARPDCMSSLTLTREEVGAIFAHWDYLARILQEG